MTKVILLVILVGTINGYNLIVIKIKYLFEYI